MPITARKFLQILVLIILLISIVSLSCCITQEEKKSSKEPVDDNGDNGNNTNGNNNNTTDNGEPIKFTNLHHDPPQPPLGSQILIFVQIEADNPLEYVQIVMCNEQTQICEQAEDMREEPANSNAFLYEWQAPAPPKAEHGDKYSYQIFVKDSLENNAETEKIEMELM